MSRRPRGSDRRALCVFMETAASLLAVVGLVTSLLTVSQTLMPPSAAAAIWLSSTGDPYLPGAVTPTTDLPAPDFSSSSEKATDLTGNNPARPGDTVQYILTFINSGDDPATNTVVSDPLPPDVTFVPGSLATVAANGTATPLSDLAGDDQAEFDPATNTVTARLGCGAGVSTGGVIVSASTTNSTCTMTQTSLSFRVILGGGTPTTDGPQLNDTAQLNYTAQTSGVNASYDVTPASDSDPGAGSNDAQDQGGPAVAISDLASSVVPSAGTGYRVTVQYGPDSVPGGTLTVNLPAGLDQPAVGLDTTSVRTLDVRSNCSIALVLTCSIGSLATGDKVVLDITGVAASSLQDGAKLTATAWMNTDPADQGLVRDPATAQITVWTASPDTLASTTTAAGTTASTTTASTTTSTTTAPTTTAPTTAPTTTAPTTTAPTTSAPTTSAPTTATPTRTAPGTGQPASTAAPPVAPPAAASPAPWSAALAAPLAAALPIFPQAALPASASPPAPPPTIVVPSASPPTEMPPSVAPANVASPSTAPARAGVAPPSAAPPRAPDAPALPAIFEHLAATGSNPFAGAGVAVILLVGGLLLMVASGVRRRK